MEGSVEYLLVLSFAPGGSLTDFLRTHTIDWTTFCKMSLTIVKGLAYLHTDVRKGGMYHVSFMFSYMLSYLHLYF